MKYCLKFKLSAPMILNILWRNPARTLVTAVYLFSCTLFTQNVRLQLNNNNRNINFWSLHKYGRFIVCLRKNAGSFIGRKKLTNCKQVAIHICLFADCCCSWFLRCILPIGWATCLHFSKSTTFPKISAAFLFIRSKQSNGLRLTKCPFTVAVHVLKLVQIAVQK